MTDNDILETSGEEQQTPSPKIEQHGGDRAVQVGQVFGNVVFHQVVSLKLVVLILISLIIAASGGYYLYWRSQRPSKMSGSFNIAVAEFQVVRESDEASKEQAKQNIGYEVAEIISSEIKAAFDKLPIDYTFDIWGPKLVGKITGNTSAERIESAKAIIAKIEADIVVYGIIDATEPTVWEVTPEFYIFDKNFSEAQEITGQYALGNSFLVDPIEKGNVSAKLAVIDEMTSRVALLSQIIEGLSHYAHYKYEKAFEVFQSAATSNSADQAGGRNVLYLLIGNAAGKLRKLDVAEESYQKALQFESEYARAYIGLAGVYYIAALKNVKNPDGTQDPTKVNVELIQQSIECYKKASTASQQSDLSAIPVKVSFGLGQCYLMLHFAGQPLLDASMKEFQAVIAEYQNFMTLHGEETTLSLGQLAAESYARVGLIYRLQGDNASAITAYQKAASLWYKNKNKEYRDKYDKIVQTIQQKMKNLGQTAP